MRSKIMGLALTGAFALAGLGAATAADAGIVNISATGGSPTQLTLDPGQYLIQFVGKADGGDFDGWNPSCPGGSCSAGWREVFTTYTDTGPHPQLDTYSVAGPAFSSALAALAGFQSNPIQDNTFDWDPGTLTYVHTDHVQINQPWIVNLSQTVTVYFVAGDGTPADNFGGVSLRFAPVPEPQVWSLMIVGFAGLGAMLRKRRQTAQAATA